MRATSTSWLIDINEMDESIIDDFGMTGFLLPWKDKSFRDTPYQYWIFNNSIYS